MTDYTPHDIVKDIKEATSERAAIYKQIVYKGGDDFDTIQQYFLNRWSKDNRFSIFDLTFSETDAGKKSHKRFMLDSEGMIESLEKHNLICPAQAEPIKEILNIMENDNRKYQDVDIKALITLCLIGLWFAAFTTMYIFSRDGINKSPAAHNTTFISLFVLTSLAAFSPLIKIKKLTEKNNHNKDSLTEKMTALLETQRVKDFVAEQKNHIETCAAIDDRIKELHELFAHALGLSTGDSNIIKEKIDGLINNAPALEAHANKQDHLLVDIVDLRRRIQAVPIVRDAFAVLIQSIDHQTGALKKDDRGSLKKDIAADFTLAWRVGQNLLGDYLMPVIEQLIHAHPDLALQQINESDNQRNANMASWIINTATTLGILAPEAMLTEFDMGDAGKTLATRLLETQNHSIVQPVATIQTLRM